MASSPWWIVLLVPLLLGAPWIAAVVWSVMRAPRAIWDEPFAPRTTSRRHLWM